MTAVGMRAGVVSAQNLIPVGHRVVQVESTIRLGSFTDSRFGFHGDMAHVVVLSSPVTHEQLSYTFKVRARFRSRRMRVPRR